MYQRFRIRKLYFEFLESMSWISIFSEFVFIVWLYVSEIAPILSALEIF